MRTRRASHRYAKALFDLASETGVVAEVEADLSAVGHCVADCAELPGFLGDVSVSRAKRLTVLEGLFSKGAHPLVWQFMKFLESKRRLPLLPEICACFAQLCEKGRGVIRVAARTAVAADSSLKEALSGGIESQLKGRIILSVEEDAALLGGFVFRAGDVIRDYSITGSLRAMRERWSAA